jgi:DNA-binding CsgD family transcriptional regulator
MMLLERDDELARLSSLLDRSAREGGQIAVVRGEAGSGKSSLVRALGESAPNGTACLVGICDPLEPPVPFGPIKDIARQHPTVAALLASTTGRAARGRLARDLAGLLQRPTLLVVEDLHWMDDATADLLVQVGRRIDETCALLVLTHRTGTVQPSLGRVLDAVVGRGTASTHELHPLSLDGVSTLVAGTALDPGLVHRRTGGNPFFVTEMVASGGMELPTTVASVVLTRVERLGRSAREVIDLASLAPDGLEISAAVAVLDDDRVLSGSNEAWAHDVLDIRDGRLVFRHELARQAVAQALPPATAQRLHRHLIEVLEDGALSALSSLVHHSVGAGDLQRVRRYALQAARSAYEQGANQVAITHVRTILDHGMDLDPAEEAQVRELLADARGWVVPKAENITARLEAADAWAAVGDRARQARQLVMTAASHHHVGDVPSGIEAVRRALGLVNGLPVDRAVAEVLATAALVSAETTPPDEARRVVEEVVAVLESAAFPEAVSKALRARAWLRILRMGDLDGGLADGLRAVDVARAEAPLHLAQQSAILGEALSEARALGHALPLIEESITAARAHDQPTLVAYGLALRAGIRLHQGRLDLAELDAAPVAHADTLGEALRTAALATVLGRRGVPGAGDCLDDPSVVAVCADQSYGWRVAAARAELCVLHADLAPVGRITADAVRWATGMRHAWAAGELRYWRRRARLDDGPPEPWVALPWHLMLLADWEGAAREWAARGCPFEQGLALSDGSEAAQREALDLFTDIGASAWADLVRDQLRRAGADGVRPRPRRQGADLTDRQREVLTLVALGLTDAEIASRLHVSVKTVGHHVSAVLMRTGARNRTEAAALSQGNGRT